MATEEVHLDQHQVMVFQRNLFLMWWHIAKICFQDILTNVPVFSRKHAIAILGILNEVFGDINESNLTDVGTLRNDDNEYIFSGFDDLLSCSYEEFVEDFPFDPDALPE